MRREFKDPESISGWQPVSGLPKGASEIILYRDQDSGTYCRLLRVEPDFPGSEKSLKHDFDEVVGFIGSDPQNPRDLCGEVEFWLEDEKYLLTNSCLIFAPKGLRHCPLHVRRVDRPILFLAVSMTNQYSQIFDTPKE